MNSQPGETRRCHTSTVSHNEHQPHRWAEHPDGGPGVHVTDDDPRTDTHWCDGRVSAADLTSNAGWRRTRALDRTSEHG